MKPDNDLAFLVRSDTLGEGEPDLGEKLISSLFQVLGEADRLPSRIMFINSGVFLTTEGTPLLTALQSLEEKGVEILSCGTCLKYYGREDKIAVGRATDMRATVSTLLHSRIVTL